MHHKPSQRKILIQRLVVYTLMTTAVVVTTIILFFLLLGYRFNPEQGEFQQGGLAQFITRPTGASVTVGRARLAAKTPSKITLNPGTYDVRMELEGYRPWLKTVSIESAQVLWLNSVRFIPQNPSTEAVSALAGFSSMTSRPEGDKVFIIEDKATPELSIFDIGGQDVAKATVTIPSSAYTASKKHSFSLETMSKNDRYAIVVHGYGKKTERLAVDVRDPEKSFTLQGQDNAGFAKVMFDPRSPERIFGMTKVGDVYRIDLSSHALSQKLLSSVTDFSFADDDFLLYVASTKAGVVTTGAQRLSDNTTYALGSFTTKQQVRIAGDFYYSKLYIATTVGKDMSVALVKDLASQDTSVVHTQKLSDVPLHLTSETKGRFFLVELKAGFSIYDIELKDSIFTAPVGQRSDVGPVQWLDEYHYWYMAGGRLQFSEFDGSNVHDLAAVAPSSKAVLGPGGRYLYSVGFENKTYSLQRTTLVLR